MWVNLGHVHCRPTAIGWPDGAPHVFHSLGEIVYDMAMLTHVQVWGCSCQLPLIDGTINVNV